MNSDDENYSDDDFYFVPNGISNERLNLSQASVFSTIWDIREGKPEPEKAKLLMQAFIDGRQDYLHKKDLTPYLFQWIEHAFREYLKNPKEGSLEKLLGIKSKRVNAANLDKEKEIAAEALRLYIDEDQPMNNDGIVAIICEKFSTNKSSFWQYWEKHKIYARSHYRIMKSLDSPDGEWKPSDDFRRKLQALNIDYEPLPENFNDLTKDPWEPDR